MDLSTPASVAAHVLRGTNFLVHQTQAIRNFLSVGATGPLAGEVARQRVMLSREVTSELLLVQDAIRTVGCAATTGDWVIEVPVDPVAFMTQLSDYRMVVDELQKTLEGRAAKPLDRSRL